MKAISALALGSLLLAQGAAAESFEVPVGRFELKALPGSVAPSGGVAAYFYAVPVRVGTTRLSALLDTGSIGLRIVPHQLRPIDIVQSDGHREQEVFAGATVLEGVAAKAFVALGGLPLGRPMTLQLIQSGHCAKDGNGQPLHCPLDTEQFSQFRFGGEGRAWVGQPAIFGIRAQPPGPYSEVFNPLNQTGHNRYVVDLPRTDRDAGRLILDPNQLETQGFVQLTHDSAAANATVRGCLVNADREEICGAMLFDSGAPSISVSPKLPAPVFKSKTTATIRFVDDSGNTLATQSFVVGSQPYAQVQVEKADPQRAGSYISLGQIPFMAFSVLIDAQAQTLAVKARPNPPPDVPMGRTGG